MLCRSASTKSKVRALLFFFPPARPARHSPQQKLTHNARSLLSRTFHRAALTLALERKNEDTARLRANHETMREQLQVLRKAAIAKLGLPAEEPAPSEEPAAAAAAASPVPVQVAQWTVEEASRERPPSVPTPAPMAPQAVPVKSGVLGCIHARDCACKSLRSCPALFAP